MGKIPARRFCDICRADIVGFPTFMLTTAPGKFLDYCGVTCLRRAANGDWPGVPE